MDARKYGKDLYGDAPEEATEAAQRAVAAESSAETGVAISSTAKEREAGAVDGVFGPADVVACSACNSVRCGAVVSGLKLCPQLAGNAATAPAAPAATTALAALAALVAPAAPGAES